MQRVLRKGVLYIRGAPTIRKMSCGTRNELRKAPGFSLLLADHEQRAQLRYLSKAPNHMYFHQSEDYAM